MRQRHQNLDLCATRSSLVTSWESCYLLSCFIFVLVLSCAYTAIYKEEFHEKLRDLKMSLELKFPLFHLTVHQISSYQTGVTPFISSSLENFAEPSFIQQTGKTLPPFFQVLWQP
jgi:hypothetical protein